MADNPETTRRPGGRGWSHVYQSVLCWMAARYRKLGARSTRNQPY